MWALLLPGLKCYIEGYFYDLLCSYSCVDFVSPNYRGSFTYIVYVIMGIAECENDWNNLTVAKNLTVLRNILKVADSGRGFSSKGCRL